MSTVYVDRGMAWCTVVGGFVANLLLGGLGKSYSLVMEAFQEVFESGSAYLFLAGGLIYTLMYCLSLVNHLLSKRYGSRPVVMVGAFGSCISLLIAACSPNLALWVVAVGFGVGASLSCIYFTVFAVVGCCFKRYLGLANGISVAGVSVGQMIFPSLITYLNTTYSARGGTVVMAAICLHLLVTAALMPRHIIDPDAPVVVPTEKAETNKTKKKSHKPQSKSKESRQLMPSQNQLNNSNSNDRQLTSDSDKKLQSPVDEFFSKLDSQRDVVHSVNNITSSIIHSSSTLSLSHVSILSLSIRHTAYLTRGLLIVYIVAKAFGDVGDVSVSFIAPVFGTELALSSTIVNRAIAIAGVGDLITRLGVGWLTDRPACIGRRGLLLGFTWVIEGLNAFAFAELNRLSVKYSTTNHANSIENGNGIDSNHTSMILTACYFICFGIHGICSGTAMTQMVVVLCDWVGSSQLAQSLAVTMVILGVVISPGQFLMGFIADIMGTYIWSLRICGIILLLAGLILFMEFPVRRLYPSARNNSNRKEGSVEQCIPVKDIEAQDINDGVINNNLTNGKHHSPVNSSIDLENNLTPPNVQLINSKDTSTE
ncbi:Monocarboxylate transporter 2 [Schistosoma japonicum]|uniref:Monocarboxylate transporter 2 n=1 Tax=Schistosoma japonicum TaxID=6182 RepID=A0A4Z2D142_SCHJA|nr:Monocarboxylate transporter 2 [Schistosoma japonicum]TNN10098.1 Monocarboxylate transporter 2 [Schistosoma japonicum]